jgi:hypothetical protein
MMARITCGSCQKPVSFDEARLPFQPVTFPCPSCKAPLTVDRRTLMPSPVSAASETSFGPPPEPPPQPPVEAPEPEDDLGDKALIVGVDSPVLRQAVREIGYQPVFFPTVEAGRDFYLQEYPPVVILHPGQLTRPPLADLQPITSLSAADRRRSFYILVADGLKTFDGTVAFLYDVNLVVATKDLPSFRRIWRDAEEHHQKLYSAFRAAEKAVREGA